MVRFEWGTVDRRRRSGLARAATLVLAVGSVLGWTQPAQAYAWMVRHGEMQCASCHADPSGGELLTKYGRLEGHELLPMKYNARAAFVTGQQGNELNLVSRTHWLALDLGDSRQWTLRAGRLNLPFGVRVPEHYLWVRDVTRTDRESDQQHGGALAYNDGKLRAEAMGIAGNYQIRPDRYRERGYSASAEYALNDGLGVGVSSLYTVAKADRVSFEQEQTSRGVHGAFARVRINRPLVLLAEADAMHISRRALGYVAFAQLDYEFLQGLHAIGTVEVLDQGLHTAGPGGVAYSRVAGQGDPQAGGWLSLHWFCMPQLDLRIDAILRQGSGGAFLAQIHAYL